MGSVGIEPRAQTRADETAGRLAVAVVVSAPDRESFFREALEPTLGRTYPPTEVDVMEDGRYGRHEPGGDN